MEIVAKLCSQEMADRNALPIDHILSSSIWLRSDHKLQDIPFKHTEMNHEYKVQLNIGLYEDHTNAGLNQYNTLYALSILFPPGHFNLPQRVIMMQLSIKRL